MRCVLRIGFALALGHVLIAGCSDDNGEGAGGVAGVSTVAKIFVIEEYRPHFGAWGPVEGVKICALDTDDCVWTNDEGRAVVQVPIGRDFGFTWEKDGYSPVLVADFRPPDGSRLIQEILMTEEERLEKLHQQVGSPYPMRGTGSILVVPLDSRLVTTSTPCAGTTGRTFGLSSVAGQGFYYDEGGNWDANLTATSCWGWGGFTEVPPGEVQIEIGTGPWEHCFAAHAWRGPIENSIRVPVRAGFWTIVDIDCAPRAGTSAAR